ncbi:MAG TPA: hypothetical protein VFS52_13310 [Steroidobacteraceae bacterium]|jgi:hypothetical protein|nr:hypothetical protein [Steroidobacteraceae bacterium]
MITRRGFLIAGGLLGSGALAGRSMAGAGALGAANGGSASGQWARASHVSKPVVAFFDGQLWLDTSGASVAYRPPGSVPTVPTFTDEELLRARGYI